MGGVSAPPIYREFPMKIRMLVSTAGIDFSLNVGDETDSFSDADALRYIEAGYAVPVPAKTERAVKAAPEKRAK
jgi:hypothetical protein